MFVLVDIVVGKIAQYHHFVFLQKSRFCQLILPVVCLQSVVTSLSDPKIT